MIESLTFRRADGSFVGVVNGMPYHITDTDPLWDAAQEIADELGDALPLEPPPPAPPPSIPADVSFWRFMLAAWQAGFITETQALAAVRDRTMPPAFADALANLPAADQAVATLKFAGITRMVRADPLFNLIVSAEIATNEQIDALFVAAAAIT